MRSFVLSLFMVFSFLGYSNSEETIPNTVESKRTLVLIFGSEGAGKSAVLNLFLGHHFYVQKGALTKVRQPKRPYAEMNLIPVKDGTKSVKPFTMKVSDDEELCFVEVPYEASEEYLMQIKGLKANSTQIKLVHVVKANEVFVSHLISKVYPHCFEQIKNILETEDLSAFQKDFFFFLNNKDYGYHYIWVLQRLINIYKVLGMENFSELLASKNYPNVFFWYSPFDYRSRMGFLKQVIGVEQAELLIKNEQTDPFFASETRALIFPLEIHSFNGHKNSLYIWSLTPTALTLQITLKRTEENPDLRVNSFLRRQELFFEELMEFLEEKKADLFTVEFINKDNQMKLIIKADEEFLKEQFASIKEESNEVKLSEAMLADSFVREILGVEEPLIEIPTNAIEVLASVPY